MELVAKHIKRSWILPVFMLFTIASPLCAQEQVVEYGKIVQADDGTGSLDYLIGYEEEAAVEEEKPWLPVLSPLMIRLDCWITRMVNINDFYSQQAADEYFAMSESCADMALSMDPNIYNNTGLKYTVLSPVYAWCPGLLNRQGILGGCGGYGIPAPMPSVAGLNYAPPAGAPAPMTAPPQTNLQPLPRSEAVPATQMGIEMGTSAAPKSETPPRNGTENVASSQWAQMSDAEILAHFGLDPTIAVRAEQEAQMDGAKLEQPVVDSNNWQFADEAPTVSIDRKDMVALNHESFPPKVEPLALPEPVVVEERVIRRESQDQPTTVEIDFDQEGAQSEKSKDEFSSTDGEYDRMKEIEKELLGF